MSALHPARPQPQAVLPAQHALHPVVAGTVKAVRMPRRPVDTSFPMATQTHRMYMLLSQSLQPSLQESGTVLVLFVFECSIAHAIRFVMIDLIMIKKVSVRAPKIESS